MNGLRYPITSIIMFSLLGISSAFQYCKMCHSGESIPVESESVVLDNAGATCKKYETMASALDATNTKCESYYQLLGNTRCGCDRPINAPNPGDVCHLCKNGASPPQNGIINLTQLGKWDAGSIECNEAKTYLVNFSVSTNTCAAFQSIGFKDCGCTDSLPTASPSSSSPTPPPGSPTESPSSKPSYTFQNTDCDAMREGIFPMINSDTRGSTNFNYTIGLELADGYSFEDVASPLQDKMDIIVSLASNEGCSDSTRRLKIRRSLGDDDVFVHYIDFENLQEIGEGLAEGNAEVFFSTFPSATRGRKLVDVHLLPGFVKDIIKIKSAEIAAGVDGVERVNIGSDLPPQGSNREINGVAIGLGVGCAAVVLIAGLLVSRKKGIKKNLSDDISRVEFLSSTQKKSLKADWKGGGLVPNGDAKVRDGGVEFYPEDFSLGSKDTLSTNRRDLVFVAADAVELTAAPRYGISDAFPIGNASGRDPYQDSDSSDDDYPMDEEKAHNPIAVRTKPSYRVKNTMDL